MNVREKVLEAVDVIQKLASENTKLKEENDSFKKHADAEKIAMDMAEKNLISKDDIKERASSMIEENVDLETVKEAVKIAEGMSDGGSLWEGIEKSASKSSSPEDAFNEWAVQ